MSSPSKDIVVHEYISLEKATLHRLEGDIIKIEFHENIEVDLEDIKKLQEPKLKLTKGNSYYQLLNAPRYASVSKEAREFSASPAANVGALGKAVITHNLGMRLIVNFFISVNKPPVPHRIFSNEADALAWIAELKKQQANKAELLDTH